MSLGEKISTLRKSRGMSQEQLAGELGISRQAVSKWELNESMPDIDKIAALSNYFGVTTDYLINSADKFSIEKDAQDKIIKDTKTKTVLGWVLSSIGTLGLIVLLTLSSFIETSVPVVYKNNMGGYTYTSRRGYSFFPFIKEHNMEFLFSILTAFLLIGLVLLFWERIISHKKGKL